MGLFSFGKKQQEMFSFRVDDVFVIKGQGLVVTGQMTGGEVRRGARVRCIAAGGRTFPCTIQKIEQPDPANRSQYLHPDTARADGPFQGSYAFWIADRTAADFHSGDRLTAEIE